MTTEFGNMEVTDESFRSFICSREEKAYMKWTENR